MKKRTTSLAPASLTISDTGFPNAANGLLFVAPSSFFSSTAAAAAAAGFGAPNPPNPLEGAPKLGTGVEATAGGEVAEEAATMEPKKFGFAAPVGGEGAAEEVVDEEVGGLEKKSLEAELEVGRVAFGAGAPKEKGVGAAGVVDLSAVVEVEEGVKEKGEAVEGAAVAAAGAGASRSNRLFPPPLTLGALSSSFFFSSLDDDDDVANTKGLTAC